MFSYFFHKIGEKPKITMVILVKNEEDIIGENIQFHFHLGVDNFVIMDNNSDDKTKEIINSLKKRIPITLIEEKAPYAQSKFMTQLNKIAQRKYNPDWIINSDADEFWVPQQGSSLKEVLNFKGGVLKVPRSNMILYQGLNRWKESEYRVANQIFYRENLEGGNIILGTIGRKVIVNPHGYIKTNSGNHSAEHIAFWRKREFSKIHIYHYPIRSYQQFERSIINRVKLLKIGAKMGSHYKKWAKLYEEGKLKEEFEKMVFDGDKIQCLEEVNILKKDTTPKSLFKQFGLL
ncbi:MAG: glycosyltransferase family 2 protein [Epsilonproteobacteria bacterium]|nr:glycosyltransferase family 2 protein [Campylobacterota bacterium]NPA88784.1 glycosyltransferase family 92 protein [Campylobacterota bacterium]